MNIDSLIKEITDAVIKEVAGGSAERSVYIPAAVSNRHVHLSCEHTNLLFGSDQLTTFKALSQPGQYACEEKVMLAGPKGVLENVRVLGPIRDKTQVEVSATDCSRLGIKAPLRHSGDLVGSGAITLIGSCGAITIKEGAIVAARHIHLNTSDAHNFRLVDGELVSVKVPGPRGLIFNEVLVRVRPDFKLEMHLDFDEANAAGIKNNDCLELCRF